MCFGGNDIVINNNCNENINSVSMLINGTYKAP